VEEIGHHGDHVALQRAQAGEGGDVQRVAGEELRVGRLGQVEDVVTGVVGEAEGAPAVPVDIGCPHRIEPG
jgi:hypothetical protein